MARERSDRPRWHGYLYCYLLFTGVIALALLVLLIWRLDVLMLLALVVGSPWVLGAVYPALVTVLGLSLFVVVMACEPYLRRGVVTHEVTRRFRRFAVPLAIAFVIGIVARFAAVIATGGRFVGL